MNNKSSISIVGAGNVGWHLAIAFFNCGYSIKNVYSHKIEHAQELAKQTNSKPCDNIENFDAGDVCFLCLKDDCYQEVIEKMPRQQALYVHTSGSLSMNILSSLSTNYGVFYPFQTFNKVKKIDFQTLPVCLEVSNETTSKQLEQLVFDIKAKPYFLTIKQREHLHLAGVLACNFTNALYGLAEAILKKEDIAFDIIKPLIKETAEKIEVLSPEEAQTGPAVRKDYNIINKHIAMLDNDNERNLYRFLSQLIQEQQNKR